MAGDVKISNGSDFDIEKTPLHRQVHMLRFAIAPQIYIDGYGYTSDGSVCNQHSGSQSHNQQWIIEQSGSYVRIKNRATGLYLDGMGVLIMVQTLASGVIAIATTNNGLWNRVGSNIIKFKNRATGCI